jgi:glutaredoxin-like protein NrdH
VHRFSHQGVKTLKKVKLFALSTCGWCRKTKRFLDAHGVEYEFEDVDLLSGDAKARCMQELARWNPRRNFPTLVIDDEAVVVGYDEHRLREALGL